MAVPDSIPVTTSQVQVENKHMRFRNALLGILIFALGATTEFTWHSRHFRHTFVLHATDHGVFRINSFTGEVVYCSGTSPRILVPDNWKGNPFDAFDKRTADQILDAAGAK